MALVPHKITALAESDAQGTDGKNIVAGAVVSLYDTNGTVVTLFDDANGANGSTTKQTDATGQVVVYVTPGEYDEEVNGSVKRRVSIGNKQITTEQLIDSVRPSQDGDVITTTGFYTAGDAGGAQWKATSTTGLTPSQTPAGRGAAELVDGSGRLWEVVPEEGFISDLWLGSKPFGNIPTLSSDDSTSFIQATLNAALNKGYSIEWGGDNYLISSVTFGDGGTTQARGITIKGKGWGRTKFWYSGTTGNVFSVDENNVQVTLSDFYIDSVQPMTDGYGLYLKKPQKITLERVMVGQQSSSNLYNGIWFDRFDLGLMSRVFVSALNDGVTINGTIGNQEFGAELVINDECKIAGCGRDGFHIQGSAGGVKFGACDIINNARNNVLIDDTHTGLLNREVFFGPLCTVDSSGNHGIVVKNNGAGHLDISGTWIATTGTETPLGAGLRIEANGANHTKVSGAKIFNCSGPGIESNAGSTVITGSYIHVCGKDATSEGSGSGLYLRESGASFVVSGNEIKDNTEFGVYCADNVDGCVVSGNDIRNNASGAIRKPTGFSDSFFRGNNGETGFTSVTGTGLTDVSTGILSDAVIYTGDLSDLPIGIKFSSDQLTHGDAILKGYPDLGLTSGQLVYFVGESLGTETRLSQEVTEIFGNSGQKGRKFRRVKQDATFFGWVEV